MDDTHWMSLALAQATEAAKAGEVPVGAVVVKDGKLIASGRNSPIAQNDPSAHAEIAALRSAARQLGNYRLEGCTLYVTLEPCPMCAGAILQSRLERVVFGASDPKTGAAGSVVNLFENSQLNHQTRVIGAVMPTECSALLQEFFQEKRSWRRSIAQPLREDALRTPDAIFELMHEFPWQAHYLSDLPVLSGLRMHYLDEGGVGEAGDSVVVALHGNSEWGYVFRKQIPVWLAAGKRVIVPDLIGFGRSDKPKRIDFHTFDTHCKCLLGLLQHLRLSSFDLVVSHNLFAPDDASGAMSLVFPDAGYKAAIRAFADGNLSTARIGQWVLDQRLT
jgi:tRNA(adenine34) deaminase